MNRFSLPRFPRLTRLFPLRALAVAAIASMAVAQVTLTVDRLDGTEPGAPAPANLVVVDLFADVATTDTWTASGLRATTSNGALLRYGAGNALVNPGTADRFVTCLSKPLARNVDARFLNAAAAVAGRYDPTGPTATAAGTEVNVAWFASPPATSTSPSVDGYIARVVIDVSAAPIDRATVVVGVGLPPPGTVALLVSQPSAGPALSRGTVAATFDVPALTGLNWSIWASPSPTALCSAYLPGPDPAAGTCNAIPFGAATTLTRSTVFTGGSAGAVGGAVYFNLTVANGLYVNQLSLNTDAPIGTALTVQLHRTAAGGTHVGNEGNPAAWIPETMGFGAAAGLNTPSPIALNSPFFLAPGTYGIAIVAHGFRHAFTSGSNFFSDANLLITTGSATNAPFTGPAVSPRTANLTLHYHTDANAFCNIRCQSIIRHQQLSAGTITGLAFSACATGRHWNDSLLIRMSHVPAGHTLSTTFASNLPTPVTVLDATDFVWHVTGNAWTEIGLQNFFAYDGARDLVIDIVARGNYHTAVTAAATAFHVDTTVPRVATSGFTGAAPATATLSDLGGLRLRLQRGCADASEYGWSCGNLRAGHSGQPVLGQTFGFTFTGAPPNSVAFLNLGLNNGSPPYPFSLAPFGLRNCHLFHEIFTTVTAFSDGSGGGDHRYNFAVTPEGVGFKFFGQWLAIDPAAPDGFSVSNYVRMLCGNTP